MRSGYQRTEAGVAPDDWSLTDLGSVSSMRSGEAITATRIDGGSAYPCYGGNGIRGYTKSFTHDGTFALIGRQGALCGNVVSVKGKFFASEHAIVVTARPGTDIDFLTYALAGMRLNRYSESSAQPGLSVSKLLKLPIALPPSEAEQGAIARVLGDVDALLDGLDRLIVKKRDLKEAVVQQLLTGRTRLRGFEGSWEPVRIGDSSRLKARIGWQGLTTAEYLTSGTYYLVTGTDFSAGRINWGGCPFVDAVRYEQDRNIQLRPNDVLVTKDGTIGKVAFVGDLPGPATLNSGVFVIRPRRSAYEPKFLYHILASAVFEDFLQKLAAGSTISHLYQKDFISFAFLAPPMLEEQAAISEVLDDMEAELAALEARRRKTHDLRQAMMQELLTGRTRLLLGDPLNV